MHTILVIDDDPLIPKFIKSILSKKNFSVYEVSSTDEALEFLQDHAPHLVLLDVRLGNEKGFDFLETLQNDSVYRKIPVIMLTGEKQASSVLMAKQLKAFDYIVKPISPTIFEKRLAEALKASAMRPFYFDKETEANVATDAKILSITEVGMTLESSVKFAEGLDLFVHSAVLEKYNLRNVIFRKNHKESHLVDNGKYTSEINIIGLHPSSIEKIRKDGMRSK